MAASQQEPPLSPTPEPEERNWIPMIVGLVVVSAIVGAVTIFGLLGRPGGSTQNDPYLVKLQLSNLHMATAQNFAGTSVTYIEGTATNAGDRKVTGARVEVRFKNSLGQISQ